MQLEQLVYSEYVGTAREWRLDALTLQPINLIVGRNASGKSRTLNVINGLSRVISGRFKAMGAGHFDAKFVHEGETWSYLVHFEKQRVIEERLTKAGKVLLERTKGGFGEIWAEEVGKTIKFQSPEEVTAVYSRRDTVQHGFLETINSWATGTFHYPWAQNLGHHSLHAIVKDAPPLDLYDPDKTAGVLRKGLKELDRKYVTALTADMAEIGYDISDIGISVPTGVTFPSPIPAELFGLFVQEKGLQSPTEQLNMSTGMYRALATLIHVNYVVLTKLSGCILIDDIGEGLDFERSQSLIKAMIKKVEGTDTQLLMTTNDRFVMNSTPLSHWTVLERKGAVVHAFNNGNSKERFEEFKFTGLNNFDFFATDFVSSEK